VKAVRYDQPRRFAVTEVPDPLHDGQIDPVYPLTPGHEIVGEVGEGVTGIRIGQRVVLDDMQSCGTCSSCRRARPAFCDHLVAQGVNAPGLEQCLPLTRDGGTRELVIKGSFSQAYSFDRAPQARRTGRVATDGIVTHTFALDDHADALAALQDRGCVKAVVEP
jgi:threonine dehydrogenase-like Zn-dependent dehydrogenase